MSNEHEFVSWVLEENRLADSVELFLAGDDDCLYLDRHVVDPVEAHNPDEELVAPACAAALALARRWEQDLEQYRSRGLFVSRPYVVIDDEWLERAENPPPPHVLITVARDVGSFHPREPAPSRRRERSGIPAIDALLTGRETLYRFDGHEDGEPGCWYLEPSAP